MDQSSYVLKKKILHGLNISDNQPARSNALDPTNRSKTRQVDVMKEKLNSPL